MTAALNPNARCRRPGRRPVHARHARRAALAVGLLVAVARVAALVLGRDRAPAAAVVPSAA